MTGNHKPVIRGVDEAIWRRVVMIPFQVVIPEEERNPDIQEIFWQEREGILGLMLDGCKAWKKQRLGKPTSISEAVKDYREEMDVLGAFLEECTIVDVSQEVKAATLYDRYANWCKRNNEYCMPQKKFGQAMLSRGEGSRRTMNGYFYAGRGLVEEGGQDHVYRGSSD